LSLILSYGLRYRLAIIDEFKSSPESNRGMIRVRLIDLIMYLVYLTLYLADTLLKYGTVGIPVRRRQHIDYRLGIPGELGLHEGICQFLDIIRRIRR